MARRTYWIGAGLLGLLANAGAMLLLHIWMLSRAGRPIIVLPASLGGRPWAMTGWGLLFAYIFLLGLALAEVPLMTIGLRALAAGQTRSDWFIRGGFLAFTFFATVYGAIFVLLTNRLDLGLTIACTGLLRLAAGIIWVKPRASR